jgi:hypothetical protein
VWAGSSPTHLIEAEFSHIERVWSDPIDASALAFHGTRLGKLTGLSRDERLESDVRRRLERLAGDDPRLPELQKSLGAWIEYGAALRREWSSGWRYQHGISTQSTRSLLPVDVRLVWSSRTAIDFVEKWLDLCNSESDRHHKPGLLGAWKLGTNGCIEWTASHGSDAIGEPSMRMRRVLIQDQGSGSGSMKLMDPGASWVEFPVTPLAVVPGATPSGRWRLHLRAQKAAVDYRPYQGSALLRVWVGGDEACGPILVTETDEYTVSIDLRSVLFPTQSTVVRLELDRDSESQCWIHFVAITAR